VIGNDVGVPISVSTDGENWKDTDELKIDVPEKAVLPAERELAVASNKNV